MDRVQIAVAQMRMDENFGDEFYFAALVVHPPSLWSLSGMLLFVPVSLICRLLAKNFSLYLFYDRIEKRKFREWDRETYNACIQINIYLSTYFGVVYVYVHVWIFHMRKLVVIQWQTKCVLKYKWKYFRIINAVHHLTPYDAIRFDAIL